MKKNFAFLLSILFMCSFRTDAKTKADQPRAQIEFKLQGRNTAKIVLIPEKDLLLNLEGPFKLDYRISTEQNSISLRKDSFLKDHFIIKTQKPLQKISGKATVFTCTKDKSVCYRDVINFEHDFAP